MNQRSSKQSIIDMSLQYQILSPFTSFVAIEDKDAKNSKDSELPTIDKMIEKEKVDSLAYIGYDTTFQSENNEIYQSILSLVDGKRVEVEEEEEEEKQMEDELRSLSLQTREDILYFAKLAEQAERYDG